MKLSIDFEYMDKFGTPKVSVYVDNIELYNGPVSHQFDFDVELSDGSHILRIAHYEKGVTDFDEEHDKHIVIKQIRLDEVDLDQLEYNKLTHRGKFYPDYEESYVRTCREQNIEMPEYFCPNHYLGHNGSWVLDFSTPAYDWIIKEQKPSGINLEDTIFSTGADSLLKVKNFFNV